MHQSPSQVSPEGPREGKIGKETPIWDNLGCTGRARAPFAPAAAGALGPPEGKTVGATRRPSSLILTACRQGVCYTHPRPGGIGGFQAPPAFCKEMSAGSPKQPDPPCRGSCEV